MARDKARERDDELTVDRRSFLGAAGAGIASAVGVGTLASSGAAADYRTVTVPAGETQSFSVGDGETLENLLIDMTADGASAKITASGDDWTIRNVGFEGEHPGGHYLLVPAVSSPDATGTIENVYMGDGQAPRSAKGGVWVNANVPHRGTIEFRNVHIAHMIDNGLYGSGPGAQGAGGVTNVYDSYFHSNMISNVRLNSRDETSYVENTTIDVDDSVRPCGAGCSAPGSTSTRAVWSWYGKTVVENCDVRGDMLGHDGGSVETRNTRTGSDADLKPPSGVPMSAEEAAGGSSSADGGDSGSSTTTESDGGADGNAEGAVLELVAGSNTSDASYEFTVEGSASKRTSAGDVAAESNDTVTDNGDGTVTVSGVAGNGYGDSFLVDGEVVSMDLDESQWTLRYEGDEVAVSDLVLPNKLVIDGSDHPRLASTYSFTVSGEARKSAALGSVNDRDTISEGEISGRVIGGKDGFRFSGEITGFSLEGPARVRVENGS
ncbi:hypothetical protein [Halorussus litoreus]|uniref:hypothetical protein n=1 Tax=Halorussus litoreus TaxID=1710536 RepID=UPI000E2809C8|nr:hypothetical protein [Halorussus litoreus]